VVMVVVVLWWNCDDSGPLDFFLDFLANCEGDPLFGDFVVAKSGRSGICWKIEKSFLCFFLCCDTIL